MLEDLEGLDAKKLNELGNAYSDYGMWDQALECYKRSLELRRESSDRRGEAIILNNLGALYHRLEMWPEAIAHYQESLKIACELEDARSQLAIIMNLAFIHFARGEREDFSHRAEEAEALSEKLEAWEPLAQINSLRGRLLMDEGSFLEAMARYGEALLYAAKEGESILEKILGRVDGEIDRLIERDSHSMAVVFCDYLLAATKGLKRIEEHLQAQRDRLTSAPTLAPPGE